MTSGRKIDDEFSSIPSKQRRYQLRKLAEGRCERCGQPAIWDMVSCKACVKYNRRLARGRIGAVREYENTKFKRALEWEASEQPSTG